MRCSYDLIIILKKRKAASNAIEVDVENEVNDFEEYNLFDFEKSDEEEAKENAEMAPNRSSIEETTLTEATAPLTTPITPSLPIKKLKTNNGGELKIFQSQNLPSTANVKQKPVKPTVQYLLDVVGYETTKDFIEKYVSENKIELNYRWTVD
jgi:hypothetical protein